MCVIAVEHLYACYTAFSWKLLSLFLLIIASLYIIHSFQRRNEVYLFAYPYFSLSLWKLLKSPIKQRLIRNLRSTAKSSSAINNPAESASIYRDTSSSSSSCKREREKKANPSIASRCVRVYVPHALYTDLPIRRVHGGQSLSLGVIIGETRGSCAFSRGGGFFGMSVKIFEIALTAILPRLFMSRAACCVYRSSLSLSLLIVFSSIVARAQWLFRIPAREWRQSCHN